MAEIKRNVCSFDQCDKDSRALGLCPAHYAQQRKGQLLRPIGEPIHTTLERFLQKVDKTDPHGCWLWAAARYPNGYGMFAPAHGTVNGAHRFAYESLVGPIPPGMVIDHICHVRICVNPEHLQAVTTKQNNENRADTTSRGVSFDKRRGKWRARVMSAKSEHWGGYYDTEAEAADAARDLRLRLFTNSLADH